jgi:hypothetical protein
MEKGEEVVTLKITLSAFEKLYNMGLIDLDEKEIKISRIEPHEVEYHQDQRWVELKQISNKAFKELKQHEFELRNGK